MSYKPFQFSQKTDYVFADDVCAALKAQLEAYKPAKLFVLASEKRFQLVSAALEELGQPYVLRTGCMSNPTADFVNESAAILTAEGCDFLLGVGGGSVIDASKAIAILAANPTEGGVWDYVSFAKMPEQPALPLGLVVTIPSTGSESNPSAVISNPASGEKLIYTEGSLRPRFSITAPQLTYTLPAKPAGEGVADILSHLLEQYLQKMQNRQKQQPQTAQRQLLILNLAKSCLEQSSSQLMIQLLRLFLTMEMELLVEKLKMEQELLTIQQAKYL